MGNVERRRRAFPGGREALSGGSGCHGPELDRGPVATVDLFFNLAATSQERARYRQAADYYRQGLGEWGTLVSSGTYQPGTETGSLADRAARLVTGSDHVDEPEKASALLCGLADYYSALGDSATARRLFAQAQGILEAAVGPDHPEVTRPAIERASLEAEAGELGPARAVLERALRIREASLGVSPSQRPPGRSLRWPVYAKESAIFVRLGSCTSERCPSTRPSSVPIIRLRRAVWRIWRGFMA